MVPDLKGTSAMSEETLFAFEQTQNRGDIAADLRLLAAQLDSDGTVTFTGDDQTVAVTPPERPMFEIEVERECPGEAETGNVSIELEIEWPESAEDKQPTVSADMIPGNEEETTAVSDLEAEAVESRGRFHLYRDRANEWRWRLVHHNGNIIATSGEGYSSRRNAEKGMQSVMKNAPGAETLTDD